MADTFTPHYNLLKPDPAGLADIGEVSGNFDKIDTELFKRALGEVAYAEITASSPAITAGAAQDVAGLSLSAILSSDRKYELEFIGLVGSSDGTSKIVVALTEDVSTQLIYTNAAPPSTLHGPPVVLKKRINAPTTATHNYKVTIYRVSGTGSVQIIAGAQFPAALTLRDIGPAS